MANRKKDDKGRAHCVRKVHMKTHRNGLDGTSLALPSENAPKREASAAAETHRRSGVWLTDGSGGAISRDCLTHDRSGFAFYF
jgi:hypothetical protein